MDRQRFGERSKVVVAALLYILPRFSPFTV